MTLVLLPNPNYHDTLFPALPHPLFHSLFKNAMNQTKKSAVIWSGTCFNKAKNSCETWPHKTGINSIAESQLLLGKSFLSLLTYCHSCHGNCISTGQTHHGMQINQDLICGQEQGRIFSIRFHNGQQPSQCRRKGQSSWCVPAGLIMQQGNKLLSSVRDF